MAFVLLIAAWGDAGQPGETPRLVMSLYCAFLADRSGRGSNS